MKIKNLAAIVIAAFINVPSNSQQDKTIFSKTEYNMTNTSFTTTIMVSENPNKVYDAINNVRGWWSEEIEGSTDELNKVFDYHFKDLHRCSIKVTELVPSNKVVWLVTENNFSFTKDKEEWKGTRMIFEITPEGSKTKMTFTHEGLMPEHECYNVCHDAWTGFIQSSLYNLIVTGKGQPNPKDGINQINSDNIDKWDLKKD